MCVCSAGATLREVPLFRGLGVHIEKATQKDGSRLRSSNTATMASLSALRATGVAPAASRSPIVPRASIRPLSFKSFNVPASSVAAAPQIQPLGLRSLRSSITRSPLSVQAAAAGGAAAPAPAKFKWGADMKNLVSPGPDSCIQRLFLCAGSRSGWIHNSLQPQQQKQRLHAFAVLV